MRFSSYAKFIRSVVRALGAALLLLLLVSCGGGGGDGSDNGSDSNPNTNATLSALTVSCCQLDQIFQASQTTYTASIGFLQHRVTVRPIATDPFATITVNGAPVSNTNVGVSIALPANDVITVEVTATDDLTTETYTVNILRNNLASYAQKAYVKASNAEADDYFGASVAISGDTLVVGAFGEDGSANGGLNDNSLIAAGAVYVFTQDEGVWSQQAYLKASNAEGADFFGYSVAISGDTLVVGAHHEDSTSTGGENNNMASNAGAVYVFVRNEGVWTQQALLKASNAQEGDNFGFSLDISGDTLVVGAPHEDSNGFGGQNSNSAMWAGAAYVFTRSNGIWTQQAYLKASNAGLQDEFGFSVAISDDLVVAGAPRERGNAINGEGDDSASAAGAAYVFTRDGELWTQRAYLKANIAEAGDFFGNSVSVSGGIIAVGAYGDSNCGSADGGAAYIFTKVNSAWIQEACLVASNHDPSDLFGHHLAISNDALLVGAWGEDSSATGGESDNSTSSAGAAYLFTRSGDVWNQQVYLKASNADTDDWYGISVAIDDGVLAIGAYSEDSTATDGEGSNSASRAGAAYTW